LKNKQQRKRENVVSTEIVVAQPSLLPQTYAEIHQMAHEMASAKMLPPWFQKSPGDCALLIRLAVGWAMDPTLLAWEVFSINGRLMPSGKLAAAVINSRGNLAERLRFDFAGEGDAMGVKVSGRLASESTPREIELKLRDIKTANEQWKRQPQQMLAYAGARYWGRRHVPELLLGVTFVEEAEAVAAAPKSINELPKIQTPPTEKPVETIDAETGEVVDPTVPRKITGKTWSDFIEPLTAAINNCQSIGTYDAWRDLNQETILKMKDTKPDLFAHFDKICAAKLAELEKVK